MRIPALWFRLGATGLCLLFGVLPAAADLLIVVDKSAQRMSVSIDGTPRYTWKVSTGRPGYDTPSGSFRPFRLERDYFSKEWDDAPMPHSIFFTKIGHAIHGSYDTRHLGTPVSHGCIRIAPENAALLFSLVEAEGLGRTKVVVAGGAPMGTARPYKTPAGPRLFAPPPMWSDRPPPPPVWYGAPRVVPWADGGPYMDQGYGGDNGW
jgi:hypothetical protein